MSPSPQPKTPTISKQKFRKVKSVKFMTIALCGNKTQTSQQTNDCECILVDHAKQVVSIWRKPNSQAPAILTEVPFSNVAYIDYEESEGPALESKLGSEGTSNPD